ncbi:hypothetical protein ACJJTC_014356 [Scirpophaga incertulas]
MVNCGACGKFLSPTGAAACSVCPTKYHRACLAIAEKTQISKDWVCPNCKRHMRRGDNSQTPVKGIGEDGDCGPPLPVTSPPAQARVAGAGPALAASESAGVSEFRREFTDCISEMREFRKELGLLREAFAAFTVRLDGVERRLEALERGQPEGDPARVTELEQSVLALKRELNERDQDALLSDLEIGQLPERKGGERVALGAGAGGAAGRAAGRARRGIRGARWRAAGGGGGPPAPRRGAAGEPAPARRHAGCRARAPRRAGGRRGRPRLHQRAPHSPQPPPFSPRPRGVSPAAVAVHVDEAGAAFSLGEEMVNRCTSFVSRTTSCGRSDRRLWTLLTPFLYVLLCVANWYKCSLRFAGGVLTFTWTLCDLQH